MKNRIMRKRTDGGILMMLMWELKCIIKFGYQLFISQITTIKKKNIDD